MASRNRRTISRSRSNQGTKWSDNDADIVLNNAGWLSTSEIASKVRRSPKAVQRKAERLHTSLRVVS